MCHHKYTAGDIFKCIRSIKKLNKAWTIYIWNIKPNCLLRSNSIFCSRGLSGDAVYYRKKYLQFQTYGKWDIHISCMRFHSVYKTVSTVLYLVAMFFYATATLQLHSRIFLSLLSSVDVYTWEKLGSTFCSDEMFLKLKFSTAWII